MPDEQSPDILALLKTAYAMELETVQNYLANSVDLDGVRAQEIKKTLGAEVAAELAHAQQVANRIKQLGGQVPGSLELPMNQNELQPPKDTTDVASVIKGVLVAEDAAIAQYRRIIRACEGRDPVTQDMAIKLLADEEMHASLFRGFLREYKK